MNINEQIEILMRMNSDKIEIYEGIEGYTKLLQKWSEVAKSPIKQIINAQQVKAFHNYHKDGIAQVVTNRVEKGLEFKNLIMFADRDLEVEKSNPATLKESRCMPVGFEFNGIILIFGDYVAMSNLNEEDNIGIIVHDGLISKSFEAMYDALWSLGEVV